MNIDAVVKAVALTSNIQARLNRAQQTAARIVLPELNSAFQDAISSEVWPWPRETIRVNNQAVGSPRNIVDTSILKASNSFALNGTTATYGWVVGYATAVHYGATIYPWGNKNAKPINLPPRPWTSAVLGTIQVPGIEPYPYKVEFKNAFIRAFNKT